MDSAAWLLDFITSPATPLWAMCLIVGVWAWRASVQGLPAVVLSFIERRKAIAAEKVADFARLREEIGLLWAECKELRQRVQECEEREQSWITRAQAAEAEITRRDAIEMGMGIGRQRAQAAASADRLEDRVAADKRAKKDKPE